MSTTVARRSIDIEGPGHGSPIPSACRIGNLLMTGNIYGHAPGTRQAPADPQEQVRLMFANLEAVLAAGGATPEHVIKLSVNVRSLDLRAAINREWARMFPDPASRPARHVLRYDHFTPPAVVACEAVAVIS